MRCMHYILRLLPSSIAQPISASMHDVEFEVEEIRLRIGRPIILRGEGKEKILSQSITANDISYLIGNATDCTFHSASKTLKEGYIPLRYGARMGVCGYGNSCDGFLSDLRDVCSVCIRLAAEHIGCANALCDTLYTKGFVSTIIISPPGYGKTTLLRDVIRNLSNSGYYVGVADERGELSGSRDPLGGFDLGLRNDLLVGTKKSKAATMMIRTMSPNVIAMDELTSEEDILSIMEAVGCGVGLLSTVHGNDRSVLDKPIFRSLIEARAFEKAIIIEMNDGKRSYKTIDLYD